MTIFNLPDLGEGLPDAEIHQWHVKEGDEVKEDQVIVSMETAKAVVEVPAPRAGKIIKLYGNNGDVIKTGEPLVEFSENKSNESISKSSNLSSKEDVFLLPDLGEGLPDAEIHQWHVKEGDKVTLDQALVSMETAKAVVEVPSPRDGLIAKLHGKTGDVIQTGKPLVTFLVEETVGKTNESQSAATVVGNIETSESLLKEAPTGVKPIKKSSTAKALPAARILAKKLNIDLSTITPTGPNQTITVSDVEKAKGTKSTLMPAKQPPSFEGGDPLKGVRKMMAVAMAESHKTIVPVTLNDDADIHAWPEKTDITFRVIRAMIVACKQEPSLNASFDTGSLFRKLHEHINIGIALDSKDGLFVPVIKDVASKDQKSIREIINRFKEEIKTRSIPQDDLRGATITLSNFGMMAGKYANPIIVPPSVAILGTGRIHQSVVPVNDHFEGHRIMPLSLTIDHRAVTGGEAARFLAAMINDLEKIN